MFHTFFPTFKTLTEMCDTVLRLIRCYRCGIYSSRYSGKRALMESQVLSSRISPWWRCFMIGTVQYCSHQPHLIFEKLRATWEVLAGEHSHSHILDWGRFSAAGGEHPFHPHTASGGMHMERWGGSWISLTSIIFEKLKNNFCKSENWILIQFSKCSFNGYMWLVTTELDGMPYRLWF